MNNNVEIMQSMITESLRIQEDSIHSAKSHFNASEHWNRVHYWIGIPTAILAAIASVSAFNDKGIWAGCIAIMVAALSAISTFINPSSNMNTHKSAGNSYLALRNRARIFRDIDIKMGYEQQELRNRFQELLEKREELNKVCPLIPRQAFEKARKGIEEGEANYKVDQEVKGAEV